MLITCEKGVLCIFFRQKVKKTDIFQNGSGGHLGFMHQRDLKIKKNVRNEFLVLMKSGITHVVPTNSKKD